MGPIRKLVYFDCGRSTHRHENLAGARECIERRNGPLQRQIKNLKAEIVTLKERNAELLDRLMAQRITILEELGQMKVGGLVLKMLLFCQLDGLAVGIRVVAVALLSLRSPATARLFRLLP